VTEYRLEEIARISGVSARNIRAYRERGLLDPPRRAGRSAYYNDSHVGQLETINGLLRRGFSSAHIAEFFASMREGADLADILGLHRAVLDPRSHERTAAPVSGGARVRHPLQVDPDSAEARRVIELQLADLVDGAVVLVDPVMSQIVAAAPDQGLYLRALLQIFESTRENIDALAGAVVAALQECLRARFGANYLPKVDEMAEFSRIVSDYRELANAVVANHLDDALRQRMVSAVSDYAAYALVSRRGAARL
jgi:DNA-binding transcriptional MerR regulator